MSGFTEKQNSIGEKKKKASLILTGLLVGALLFSLVAMAGCGNTNTPEPNEGNSSGGQVDPSGSGSQQGNPDSSGNSGNTTDNTPKPKTQEDEDKMRVIAEARAQKLLADGIAVEIIAIRIFPANAPDGYEIEYLDSKTRKTDFFVFQG